METISLFEPTITEGKPTTVLPDNIARIAVIGVGGGGCNMGFNENFGCLNNYYFL